MCNLEWFHFTQFGSLLCSQCSSKATLKLMARAIETILCDEPCFISAHLMTFSSLWVLAVQNYLRLNRTGRSVDKIFSRHDRSHPARPT
jgi:hypothetical protein